MKKIFGIMLAGCLLALINAAPTYAQLPGATLRASIPFDFIVSGRNLAAGKYEISRISDEPVDLLIQNVNHRRDHVIIGVEAVDVKKIQGKSSLVFHRYGDTYFLSEVVTAGDETGREVVPSRAERLLRGETASNRKVGPETVNLALN